MTPLLDARGVTVAGRLKPTDLRSSESEMIAVIGPNGAGKTSLMRALARIDHDAGEVRICGENVAQTTPARRMRLLSFLPATRSLVWPISARDVIALGLPSRDLEREEELIDLLELHELADRPVNHLSTGERSRVLLARALAARPRLLLLDEPLSNLDPYWVLRTLEIVGQEARTSACSVLASVHDLDQIAAFDRVLLVDDGAIIADGAPAEILESAVLSDAFRIRRANQRWEIREPIRLEADRRS